jgi:hypothetical protein
MKNLDGEELKVKSAVAVDHSVGEGGRIMTFPLDGQETQEWIQSQLDAYREADAESQGMTVTWSSVALPHLVPGMYVALEGVGDYFSCNYILQKIDLTVDSSGATMSYTGLGKGFPAVNPELDTYAADVSAHKDLPVNSDPDSVTVESTEG